MNLGWRLIGRIRGPENVSNVWGQRGHVKTLAEISEADAWTRLVRAGCSLEPVHRRHGPICKYSGVLRAILLAGRCCQSPATQDWLLRRTSRFMGEAFWAGCFSD